MQSDQAEMVAIQALGHIAADDELLIAFLDITGLSPADLQARGGDREILGGVLDFILMDEARLLAFCEATGVKPEVPGRARKLLPGGEEVHWT